MSRLSVLDEKTVANAKAALKQLGVKGFIANKLKAVISAKKHGICLTADVFNVNRKTLTSWIKEVKSGNIAGLEIQAGRGRKPKITKEHEAQIGSWLDQDPNITIDQMLQKIIKKFKVELSRATVHRAMQRISFSYIKPRPLHYKQDLQGHEEFKKKDQDKIKGKS